MRASRSFLSLTLAGALVAGLTTAASAGWHRALSDDQGTGRGAGVGPAVGGVQWLSILQGLEYDGSHGAGGVTGYPRPVVLDRNGHVLTVAKDTTADTTSFQRDSILVAVDTATGAKAWEVDDVVQWCAPAVAPDGTIWAVRLTTVGGDRELLAIDPATGSASVRFTKPTASAGNPAFSGCDSNRNAPLRLSPDGETLYVMEKTYGGESADWLRAIDITTTPATTRWILKLNPTDTPGSYGEWYDDIRIAPAGSPAQGTVYLFERTWGGTNTGVGQDDVTWIHAIDPDALAGTVATPAAIDRSVELGVTQLWTGAIVVLGDTIFVSAEEALAGRVPADGPGVNGRNFKVVDDGTDLTIARTVASYDSTNREPGDHPWHFQFLTAGDDDTLIGAYRGTQGVIAGMDAETLQQTFTLPALDCLSSGVVADAAGNAYFHDFCDSGGLYGLGSVTPHGVTRWLLGTGEPQPVIGGGTIDLDDYSGFQVKAITDDGQLLVTGMTGSGAPEQGVFVLSIDLGEVVARRAGASRLETAIQISQTVFAGGAGTVVLARADQYPDALSGAPLAVAEGGPLLLTFGSELAAATKAEIGRLGATHAILLGGEAALSDRVRTDLEAAGLTVERIRGDNRFDTARKIRDRLGTTKAVIVEGANLDPARGWPDAVAASGWAASTGRAILLATRDVLPAETAEALSGISDAVIVGGTAAISAGVQAQADAVAGTVDRIFGASRYDTSRKVAERSIADGNSLDVLWLATGTGFADALTAGPASALTSGVLLFVYGPDPAGSPEAFEFLAANADDIGAVYLIGGESAISAATAAAINAALGR
jgi:hypothetical protein